MDKLNPTLYLPTISPEVPGPVLLGDMILPGTEYLIGGDIGGITGRAEDGHFFSPLRRIAFSHTLHRGRSGKSPRSRLAFPSITPQ